MIASLKRARHLLASCGWSGPINEPFSVDSAWQHCHGDFEGVARFSVQGALIEAKAWPDGWHALEAIAAPAHAALSAFRASEPPTLTEFRHLQKLARLVVTEPDLEAWLRAPQRTDEDVLRLFVLAIQRSKKSGERRG